VKIAVKLCGYVSATKEEKMVNDAIVLWGLLLLYGIPICAIAYWLEKMITKGEGGEDGNNH
jgi:hypothetical protein